MRNLSVIKGLYQGNGVTRRFAIPFEYNDTAQIFVTITTYDEGDYTYRVLDSTEYTIDEDSVEIVYPKTVDDEPIPSTQYLTVWRDTDLLQLMDLTNQGAAWPDSIEASLDKLHQIVQELAEGLSRSLKVDIGDPQTPDEKLVAIQDYVLAAAESSRSASASAVSANQAAEAAATSEANAAESERLAGGYADTATDAASRAEDSAISARAYNAPDYDNETTYQAGDVVTFTDGNSYRALQETTGNEPPNIIYWQKVTDYVGDDFFEVDEYGYIVPMDSPSHSRYWRVDQNGYIVPIEGGDGGYRPDTRSLSAEYLNVTNEGYVKHLRADDISAEEVDADEVTAEVAAFNTLTANAVNADTANVGTANITSLPNWQEYLAESTGYGIVSGCEPSISGLTVTVASGVVHLADGTRKEIASTNVTLDNADSSKPRTDLIYIAENGEVRKINGALGETLQKNIRTYAVTNNFSNGDTVTFGGVTFTATNDTQDATHFEIKSELMKSATNLAFAIRMNPAFNNIYGCTADSNGVITIAEAVAGSGNIPGEMTASGAGSITTNSATVENVYTSNAPTVEGIVICEIAVNPNSAFGELTDKRIIIQRIAGLTFVDDYGAVGDGVTDDLAAIQLAINNGNYVVLSAHKTYFISSTLYLHKNLTIDLNGGTIKLDGYSISNVKPNQVDYEYNGEGNIILKNGTIENPSILFAHAKHITAENINFIGCRGHIFQIMSCNLLTVRRCKMNFININGNVEAVNLDPCAYTAASMYGAGSPAYDGTINDNIVIADNELNSDNSEQGYTGGAYLAASHYDLNSMAYHKNIFIRNNVISTQSQYGLYCVNLHQSDICGNIIKPKGNTTNGVSISGGENISVHDNIFLPNNSCHFVRADNSQIVSVYGNTFNGNVYDWGLTSGTRDNITFGKIEKIKLTSTMNVISGTDITLLYPYNLFSEMLISIGNNAENTSKMMHIVAYNYTKFEVGQEYTTALGTVVFKSDNKISVTTTDSLNIRQVFGKLR